MRYERKYRVENIAPSVVRQVVINHPLSFRKAYPDRKVHNIYFDNSIFSAFYDNVAGVSERKKVRVRWYGDDILNIQNPRIETKIKSNQLGTKESFPVSDFRLDDLIRLTSEVNKKTGSLNFLQPVLINSYQRSYFETTDHRYRITIDRQLRYFSLMNARKFTRFQVEDQAVILELKYDEAFDDEAANMLQYIPFRYSKSSKYITGLNLFAETY